MKIGSTSNRRAARPFTTGRFDPAAGIAVVLAGCLLTFYLIGIPIIAVGAWMLAHQDPRSV